MIGKVIKGVGGVFTVLSANNRYTLFAPKKIRYNDNDILVGDDVQFVITEGDQGVVESVLPRKNRMLRPEIANVDVALILVSVEPQPDFILVDKIIINCFANNLQPVVVINKSDIAGREFCDSVVSTYQSVCDVVTISAKNNTGIECLTRYFEGNVVCLAGQSAVGKTSLLNSLLPNVQGNVGQLSAKINRGRHTTRHSEIYQLWGGYIVDTTGFSFLEILDIDYRDLVLYYPEFQQFVGKCKYNMCTHTVEPHCALKEYLCQGNSLSRYDRYLYIYKEFSQQKK